MKIVTLLLAIIFSSIGNSKASTTLAPTYYTHGNLKCAKFLDQKDPRYFSGGDKSLVICDDQKGFCSITLDHPLTTNRGANIWLKVNSTDGSYPLEILAGWRTTAYLDFACPIGNKTIRFAIEKNHKWDNNGGEDYIVNF